jgi:hypothetical protein
MGRYKEEVPAKAGGVSCRVEYKGGGCCGPGYDKSAEGGEILCGGYDGKCRVGFDRSYLPYGALCRELLCTRRRDVRFGDISSQGVGVASSRDGVGDEVCVVQQAKRILSREFGYMRDLILILFRSYHSTVNFFGGLQDVIGKDRLEIIEKRNEGAMFVMLSDVFLDKVAVSNRFALMTDVCFWWLP